MTWPTSAVLHGLSILTGIIFYCLSYFGLQMHVWHRFFGDLVWKGVQGGKLEVVE
jgi:hypothetical protein